MVDKKNMLFDYVQTAKRYKSKLRIVFREGGTKKVKTSDYMEAFNLLKKDVSIQSVCLVG